MPDSGSGPRKGAPKCTYQETGQSSEVGSIGPNIGDRHQTSTTEGEIGHWRSERNSVPGKMDPKIILSQHKTSDMREA